MTRGSLSPDSAITSAPGRAACARRATSATMCSGVESMIAWMASSRSPSTWKSRTHCSALWQIHSRTPSRCSPSTFSPSPQGVGWLPVKYGPNAISAPVPDAPTWL